MFRFIKKEGAREIVVEAIRSWLWPPLAAGVSVVIGFAQDIPWFYIAVGACVIFSAVATGLLRFDEWRFRQTVKNKLNFASLRVTTKLNLDGSVESVGLGFILNNSALFPVEFAVKSLQTQLADRFPPKREYDTKRFIVAANGNAWFDDFHIEMPDPPRNQAIEGSIKFEVCYGRPGQLNCTLGKKLKINIGFDGNGNVHGSNWTELR
ncbi:MAG: hypothetical protein WD767_12850 [Alphaproteobacteria bacterium]